ncbi:hypothetical protein FQZ97_511120 [compost metagenome]
MVRKFCRTRRSSLMSLSTRSWLPCRRKRTPCSWASALNSAPSASNSSSSGKGVRSGVMRPFSRREMSSRSLIRSSAERSELSRWRTSSRASFGKVSGWWARAAENSRAAFSGCIRSWLTAARKRVFEALADSATPLAWLSSWFSSESSRVRSSTRCSRPSLASFSACSASRNAVMSVKLMTKPPPGIGLPISSITRPLGNSRSEVCAVPWRIQYRRRSTCCSTSPGPHRPRSALKRMMSAIGRPTLIRSSGYWNSSR